MATSSSEEMVFETIQQLDYPVLREVPNLIGTPEKITGTKFELLKMLLRELSSVELEGTEIFKKIESLIKYLIYQKIISFHMHLIRGWI